MLLGEPVRATDAVTKRYVDNNISGHVWKPAVRVASTADVDIINPAPVIDGVTLQAGDSILLKNQDVPSENGIWLYQGANRGLDRRSDAADAIDILPNTTVFVSEGDTHRDTQWTLVTDGPLVIGSTALTFAQSGGVIPYTAGDGLGMDALEFHVVAEGDTILVGPGGIQINSEMVAKKLHFTIGDGENTEFVIDHELATAHVLVAVYDAATNDEVYPDVHKVSDDTVRITFAEAPATDAYLVVVVG